MEDIQETLHQIIMKYDLDTYYPNFRKRLQAEKILYRFLDRQQGRIACIATYSSDLAFFRHFVRRRERADYFLCRKAHNYESAYSIAYDVGKLADVDWKQYGDVVLVSLEGASFIRHWLRQHGIRHTFLYELFALQGLVFDKAWTSLLSDPEMEWWTYAEGREPKCAYLTAELMEQIQGYRAAHGVEERTLHLDKAYFLALYTKDFLLARRCVERMGAEAERQRASWCEVEALLTEIKDKLAQTERKDILLLWTDALPYEDVHRVPFLAHKMEEGISFDNIFTVCPNTNPTIKTLLCGKMPVDENTYALQEITEENSPVYRELQRHGYEICVIGDWPSIREEDRSTCRHDAYEPSSMGLWDLWRNIVQRDQPTFFLVHALQESHSPYLSPLLLDEDMENEYLRFDKSCAYLSEQYAYYLPQLPISMVKLYLTDHGKEWYATRFHTYLVIEGDGISPRRIPSLCSFVDFPCIMAQLLSNHTVEEAKLRRDYVEVQDLDMYNPAHIAAFIAKKYAVGVGCFGYRGIITDQYMYLRFTDGREWFVERGKAVPEPNLFGSFLCSLEAVAPFRAMVRERERGVPSFEEKLKYSRYVHEVFRRAWERNLKKKKLLDGWLAEYPPGSLAIRTGGEYAGRLYSMLSDAARERIGGFVDVNRKCLCAGWGLPVYSEIGELPATIEGVLLAGRRTMIECLREEAAMYGARLYILDPYRFLEEHGIFCPHGVGDFEAEADDYDVGFPFEEVVAW